MSGYYAMLNTTRWQRSKGRDFVFYDPHPGFVDGNVEANYHLFMCDTLQFAMHILVERSAWSARSAATPASFACLPEVALLCCMAGESP